MNGKVSIIIAVGMPGPFLEECVGRCLGLEYPDYEIIVLPDDDWTLPDTIVVDYPDYKIVQTDFSRVRVIPTGKVRPAEKRDRGVTESLGDIVAIIDDDAYPERDWLSKAVVHFGDPTVAAVGGPGITPPGDSLRRKISGWIYESPLVSASYVYRYVPRARRDVDDYPTSSLIIRKRDFIAAGGFDTGYWPGEDTILCMKLTHELGRRIVYDPGVRVYHHRRDVFGPHLRQVRRYAYHRGFFARRFPATSLRVGYFVPSLFTVFALFGWMTFLLHRTAFVLWGGVMLVYAALALVFSLRTWNPAGILGVFSGTVLTHIVYGFWFVAGLFTPEIHD